MIFKNIISGFKRVDNTTLNRMIDPNITSMFSAISHSFKEAFFILKLIVTFGSQRKRLRNNPMSGINVLLITSFSFYSTYITIILQNEKWTNVEFQPVIV